MQEKLSGFLQSSRLAIRGQSRGYFRRVALLFVLACVPALFFYTYLHYSETGRLPALPGNITGLSFAMVAGFVTGATLFRFNKMLNRRIPWTNYFISRFIAGFFCNSIITVGLLWLLSSTAVMAWGKNVFWKNSTTDDADVAWKVVILAVGFVFVYNVIYTLLYAYQHYAVAQLEKIKRDRMQLELQFEALKSQISPHYLFNSLNTISSLLMKDLQSAEQFIRRLAQTYQYVLATQNKKYVPLREELEFLQSYYYLLRIRFQQQLNVEINVPTRIMNTRIPPLTLQMLLENAVKHNTFAGDQKLFIYIMAQDNTYLKVINTKTGRLENANSFRVGLENIRQRYHYLTDKQILIQDDDKFTVSLPVLDLQEEKEEKKNSA